MSDSILDTVKGMIPVPVDYTPFDNQIIPLINLSFLTLYQIGVGPQDYPFSITGRSETWDQFMPDEMIEAAKTYVGQSVALKFDPPTNGAIRDAKNELIKEAEWRLNVYVETPGREAQT